MSDGKMKTYYTGIKVGEISETIKAKLDNLRAHHSASVAEDNAKRQVIEEVIKEIRQKIQVDEKQLKPVSYQG